MTVTIMTFCQFLRACDTLIRHVLVQAQMPPILVFYFSNYCINCTLVELKASDIIRDIGMVTDSPPLPFMTLLSVQHAFSGVELA